MFSPGVIGRLASGLGNRIFMHAFAKARPLLELIRCPCTLTLPLAAELDKIRSSVTYVTEKDPDTIQNSYLMTLYQHYIISNSTLHWPGGAKPCQGKIVIAPAQGWAHKKKLAQHLADY